MSAVKGATAAVRELRENAGWIHTELATKARVSRSFLADVEAGKPSGGSSKLFDLFHLLADGVALRNTETGEFRR